MTKPPDSFGIGAPSSVPTPKTDSLYPSFFSFSTESNASDVIPPSVTRSISPLEAPACFNN